MLAKMIDKIVSLKETKIFEIGGQTYADASLTRIQPHVDRPDCISVSGLDMTAPPHSSRSTTSSTTTSALPSRRSRGRPKWLCCLWRR